MISNIIENFPFIEFFYTIIMIFVSLLIYYKINKLYLFSKYPNIKYFNNAFLFFAIAFFVRFIYFLSTSFKEYLIFDLVLYNNYILIVFEFLFLLPGFYFLLSLLYKHIKNFKILIHLIFMLIFILISLIDYFWHTFFLMYITAVIIFFFNTLISYFNHKTKKTKYSQLYFIAIFLLLFSWIINFSTQYLLDKLPYLRFYTYLMNIIALFIIFYVVHKILKDF
jgi:hypothetical protein